MKTSRSFLPHFCFLALFFAAAGVGAEPALNRYDALGRTLVPLVSIFSPQSAQRGLAATLVLESMTGLPPEMAGSRVELALAPPDRLLVRGPFGGETVAVCRVGQEIWITPGARFSAFATPPAAADPAPSKKKKKKKKDKKPEGLPPLALPFPPQQLALLPVLFQVAEGEPTGGFRVLEVKLMPELARRLGVEEWSARLFLDEAIPGTPRLARLELFRPGWRIAVRVETLEIVRDLPAATWEPASADVLRLSGREARRWAEALGARIQPSPSASQPGPPQTP